MPTAARADDVPAKPPEYFNDYAHVVDEQSAQGFNTQLADFERQTSNQIVVAVYPKMQSSDGLDDYCYRVAQAWGVGQKKVNNGAVLFVFVQDHKMRIQTGYGLEGALPDITCDSILNDQMAPFFKRGDYTGGLRAGINSMIAATKGEYKGTGRTVADGNDQGASNVPGILVLILFVLFLLLSFFRRTQGVMYGSTGRGYYGGWSFGGGGGGGFSGGGGGFSGGFSGGGGSFGGGGASGSW
jgi:uncharacterized protein